MALFESKIEEEIQLEQQRKDRLSANSTKKAHDDHGHSHSHKKSVAILCKSSKEGLGELQDQRSTVVFHL